MKSLSILLLGLPFLLSAKTEQKQFFMSSDQGIRFEEGLNWQQVLAKAKAENKNIFVDCYTTWCGPCMMMEKEVYGLQKVGDVFNNRFICVKMQMDSTAKDDDAVRASYADARHLERSYGVNAYPTFLFFSPEGQILNKTMGAQSADDFIQLAGGVMDPEKNYYHLLKEYKHGKRNLTEMGFLARTGMELVRDTAQSREVAREYMRLLKADDYFKIWNIEFLREFTTSPKDVGFAFFFLHADSINAIMDQGDTYAQQFVQMFIYNEMVLPEIKDDQHPMPDTIRWNKIEEAIRLKYNDYYAERVITGARSDWNLRQRNWPEYTKYFVRFVEKFGPKQGPSAMLEWVLNNYAWAVFLRSTDNGELNKALSWSGRAVMMDPNANWMDTYANILYKLGRSNEAVHWETVAGKVDPNDGNIQTNLEKMNKHLPTWPQE
jgi:thioredoxin-related protein